MSILDLSKSLMYECHYNYIKTSMEIRQNYSSPTPTISYMKLRPKIFTTISTPTLRNGLTLLTTWLIIHLELKQDLIVKCFEYLRMKLVGSRLLSLLVWDLNFTLTKCLVALKTKNVRGWQRKCLFSRREQHRKMNVIRSHCHEIYTEEINKIALSSDDDKRVIVANGMHTLAYGHTILKNFD